MCKETLLKFKIFLQKLTCIYGVSVWDDEKILEMDSGDDCTTLWIYGKQLLIHFKTVKFLNVMLYEFLKNKQKQKFLFWGGI